MFSLFKRISVTQVWVVGGSNNTGETFCNWYTSLHTNRTVAVLEHIPPSLAVVSCLNTTPDMAACVQGSYSNLESCLKQSKMASKNRVTTRVGTLVVLWLGSVTDNVAECCELSLSEPQLFIVDCIPLWIWPLGVNQFLQNSKCVQSWVVLSAIFLSYSKLNGAVTKTVKLTRVAS